MPAEIPIAVESQEVVDWANLNQDMIYDTLLGGWKIMPKFSPHFDINYRTVCEMNLSHFVNSLWELPDGYQVDNASVVASCGQESRLWFGSNGQKVIIFTPGEFEKPDNKNLQPGDCINSVVRKAPELMHIYQNGLAIMHGDRDEVFQALGVQYVQL